MELRLNNGQVFDESSLVKVRVRRQIDPLTGKMQPEYMDAQLKTEEDLQPATDQQYHATLWRDGQPFITQVIIRCDRQGDLFDLRCRNDTDFLKLEYYGGLFANESLGGILDEMLMDRDRFNLDYEAGPITGHIPICTRGQALEMIAFSQGGYLHMTRDNLLDVQKLQRKNPIHIPARRIITTPQLQMLPGYSRVELAAHSYELAKNWVLMFSSREYALQQQTIKFSEPVKDFSFSVAQVIDSSVNHVTFMPDVEREELRVLPYLHRRDWYSYSRPNAGNNTRILSVRDNTLITPQNAQSVLEHLKDLALLRQQLQLMIHVDGEDVGQYVTVDTPWGVTYSGFITKMDSTLTPYGHTALITVLASVQEE